MSRTSTVSAGAMDHGIGSGVVPKIWPVTADDALGGV